jgi:hypothetical protein
MIAGSPDPRICILTLHRSAKFYESLRSSGSSFLHVSSAATESRSTRPVAFSNVAGQSADFIGRYIPGCIPKMSCLVTLIECHGPATSTAVVHILPSPPTRIRDGCANVNDTWVDDPISGGSDHRVSDRQRSRVFGTVNLCLRSPGQ